MIDYGKQLAKHAIPALIATGWSWERMLRLLAISSLESKLGTSELYRKSRNHTGIICTGNPDYDFKHAKGCHQVSSQYTFRVYGTSLASLRDTVRLINSNAQYSAAFYAPTVEEFATLWAASPWCAGDCGPYAQNLIEHYEELQAAGRKIGTLYGFSAISAIASAWLFTERVDKRIAYSVAGTSLILFILTFIL